MIYSDPPNCLYFCLIDTLEQRKVYEALGELLGCYRARFHSYLSPNPLGYVQIVGPTIYPLK
jgi:hypothetical protein